METESTTPPAPKQNRLAAVVPVWAILLILFFAVAGWGIIGKTLRQKREAFARHSQRMNHQDEAPPKPTGGPGPTEVRVGIYVDRVSEFSIKETAWTVDFYVWFLWQDKDLTPGESFQIIDGEVESREKKTEAKLPDGSFYVQYRVKAKMTKFFDISRFPADDHLLTIRIEDAALPIERLRYLPDKENSSISSRVEFPGYETYKILVVVQPHGYKTTRGDPRLAKGSQATFSQLIYGVWIKRDGLGFYLKLFQGLFAAVAIAFIAFFIKPTDVDPRFGLPVCAFFGAVANSYILASLLPDTAVVSLADMVNGLGMATIFLTLVQSALSLYLYDIRGEEALSQRLDRVSRVIFAVGYVGINIAIPIAAKI